MFSSGVKLSIHIKSGRSSTKFSWKFVVIIETYHIGGSTLFWIFNLKETSDFDCQLEFRSEKLPTCFKYFSSKFNNCF